MYEKITIALLLFGFITTAPANFTASTLNNEKQDITSEHTVLATKSSSVSTSTAKLWSSTLSNGKTDPTKSSSVSTSTAKLWSSTLSSGKTDPTKPSVVSTQLRTPVKALNETERGNGNGSVEKPGVVSTQLRTPVKALNETERGNGNGSVEKPETRQQYNHALSEPVIIPIIFGVIAGIVGVILLISYCISRLTKGANMPLNSVEAEIPGN
ncbi:glycophorin-A isoform X1 [Oryctolagus cuniculus]|uniref:glycophorin-A isoform X1 n=1 Tax=Oryctolagus cuniculus TaxID=9986 RepID=UPI00387A2341